MNERSDPFKGTVARGLAIRWPDGSFHNLDLPFEEGCCISGPAFDAAGNLTLLGLGGESGRVLDAYTYDPDGMLVSKRAVPSDTVIAAAIVVAPEGSATVVWRQGRAGGEIRSATAPPGGSFGSPEKIASGSYSSLVDIQLARDRRGDLLTAWDGGPKTSTAEWIPGPFGSIHVSFRPAGGAWGPPERVPNDPVTDIDWQMELAMNDAGDALLAWAGDTETGIHLVMSYRPAGGRFEPATLGPANTGTNPRTAVGEDGSAIVVNKASRNSTYSDLVLQSFDHLAGGSFGPPLDIADVGDNVGIDVAVDRVGDAVAVWDRRGAAPIGMFSAVHHIDPSPEGGGLPSVSGFRVGPASGSRLRSASNKPGGFSYRLSRRARVVIGIKRVRKHRPAVSIAKLRGALRAGPNSSPIPPDVVRRLKAGRYRATIVAISRSGRHSKRHVITFRVTR